jgi:hypothetical protein
LIPALNDFDVNACPRWGAHGIHFSPGNVLAVTGGRADTNKTRLWRV